MVSVEPGDFPFSVSLMVMLMPCEDTATPLGTQPDSCRCVRAPASTKSPSSEGAVTGGQEGAAGASVFVLLVHASPRTIAITPTLPMRNTTGAYTHSTVTPAGVNQPDF